MKRILITVITVTLLTIVGIQELAGLTKQQVFSALMGVPSMVALKDSLNVEKSIEIVRNNRVEFSSFIKEHPAWFNRAASYDQKSFAQDKLMSDKKKQSDIAWKKFNQNYPTKLVEDREIYISVTALATNFDKLTAEEWKLLVESINSNFSTSYFYQIWGEKSLQVASFLKKEAKR